MNQAVQTEPHCKSGYPCACRCPNQSEVEIYCHDTSSLEESRTPLVRCFAPCSGLVRVLRMPPAPFRSGVFQLPHTCLRLESGMRNQVEIRSVVTDRKKI